MQDVYFFTNHVMTVDRQKHLLPSAFSIGLALAVSIWPIAKFALNPEARQAFLMLASLPACLATALGIWMIGRFASERDIFTFRSVRRLATAGKLFLAASPLLVVGHYFVRSAMPELSPMPPIIGLACAFLAGIGACSIFLSTVVEKGLSLKKENEGFI